MNHPDKMRHAAQAARSPLRGCRNTLIPGLQPQGPARNSRYWIQSLWRKYHELLLAIVPVLFATYTLRRSPAPVSGDPNKLADTYYQSEQFELAAQTYEKILCIDPNYWTVYERLSGCYWEMGDPEKSIETWKRASAWDPDWLWPHLCLALDYNDMRRQ